MPTRVPRWAWLLMLPALVGALLLMHGLDSHSRDSHRSAGAAFASVVAEHHHEPTHDESTQGEHAHCLDCLAGHVMAACIAIITAISGIGLARRRQPRGSSLGSAAVASAGRLRTLVELARPPDPAWVRLSVMLR